MKSLWWANYKTLNTSPLRRGIFLPTECTYRSVVFLLKDTQGRHLHLISHPGLSLQMSKEEPTPKNFKIFLDFNCGFDTIAISTKGMICLT